MKIFMFRYLISLFCLFLPVAYCAETTYASLSPVPTEIIYALGAQDRLKGVSTTCNYPEEAKSLPKIGDTYFVNLELLMELKPDYLFSMSSAKPMLGELKLTKTKPVYFEFSSISEIYEGIEKIALIVGKKKEAVVLIEEIKAKIAESRTDNPKKILYLIQTNPMITVGKKSFLNDVIEHSGHISVTKDLNYYYPSISTEFAVKSQPDVIIIAFPTDLSFVKKMFPNAKLMFLNAQQQDIINRSGPRIYEAVKMFADLDFNTSQNK